MQKTFNYVYYRIMSERDSHTLDFKSNHISVNEIKSKIISRRISKIGEKSIQDKTDKEKEDFDLEVYEDEDLKIKLNNTAIIEPHKKVFIRRIPICMSKHGFISVIGDSHYFNLNTESNKEEIQETDTFSAEDKKRYSAIIDHLSPNASAVSLLNKEITERFSCNYCFNRNKGKKFYTNTAKWLMSCCGESLCESCIDTKRIKNENVVKPEGNTQNITTSIGDNAIFDLNNIKFDYKSTLTDCLFCHSKYPGYTLNVKLLELKSKLSYIANNLTSLCAEKKINDSFVNTGITGLSNESSLSILLNKSRYLIVKSNNLENIEISKEKNVWATTKNHLKNIIEAYNGKDYLILIFSSSKSNIYHGFALMTSLTYERNENIWKLENITLGQNFTVNWLCAGEVAIKDFANEIAKESVGKNRDTLELSRELGISICKTCVEKEREKGTSQGEQLLHLRAEIEIPKLLEIIRKEKEKGPAKLGNYNYSNMGHLKNVGTVPGANPCNISTTVTPPNFNIGNNYHLKVPYVVRGNMPPVNGFGTVTSGTGVSLTGFNNNFSQKFIPQNMNNYNNNLPNVNGYSNRNGLVSNNKDGFYGQNKYRPRSRENSMEKNN